ncbi:MAG: D-cysteine desulfhydrase family protein [Bacillota bacterium]|jgi:1-aminocyclopropane-1-carboxylate deaminase/D-cysteine desulfhydrase-like pyridoxal-dependent ACC family enzyme
MYIDKLGFPRVTLSNVPTPFEEAPRFAEALGGPRVFLKRDDVTALALGGNKARKLEFLLGDALQKKCDTVITTGGPQSNHARMTAAAARRAGLHPVLVLDGEDPGVRQGNLLLDHILGAELIFSGERPAEDVMSEVGEGMRKEGKRPYLVPLGGSSSIGTLGYIGCASEIVKDCARLKIRPKAVYLATGSSGTLAGLVLGKLLNGASFLVQGVAVSPDAVRKEARAEELVLNALGLIRDKLEGLDVQERLTWPASGLEKIRERVSMLFNENTEAIRKNISVTEDFVGPGYGIPTREGLEAIFSLARTEGVITDPVYSGKALACLMAHIRQGLYSKDDVVVFLHTGGAPADFAYSDIFFKERI